MTMFKMLNYYFGTNKPIIYYKKLVFVQIAKFWILSDPIPIYLFEAINKYEFNVIQTDKAI